MSVDSEKRLKLAVIVFAVGFGFLTLAACGAFLYSSAEQTDYQAWGWFYRLMNGDPEAEEILIEKLEEDLEQDLEHEWPGMEQPQYTPALGPPEGFADEPNSFYDQDQWQYE